MPVTLYEKIRPHLTWLTLLTLATLLVYGRILGHDFQLVWDDNRYVIENTMVHGFSVEHIKQAFREQYFGNYAPMQMMSYMLDFELWKMWPGGYLLTNLLLHVVNGLLVYRLFFALHGDRIIATIGVAIFLLHPLQVESVAWVSQRKTLLAMLFFLLAWEFYRWYRQGEGGRRKWSYLFSVILYSCAIFSKSVVVIFPLIIVCYDYCFSASTRNESDTKMHSKDLSSPSVSIGDPAFKPGFPITPSGMTNNLLIATWYDKPSPIGWRYAPILDKIPYILTAVVAAVINVKSQAPAGDNWDAVGGGLTGYHGGSRLATFYSMLPVFCRYIGLIVWPAGLNAKYHTPIHYTADGTVWLAAAALVVIGWLCYRLLRYDRRLGFWALLFWIGFLPVSQIIPLVTLMNDRYVYFPMLGAAALFGAACNYVRRNIPPRTLPLLYFVIAALLAAISVTSYQRAGVWKNSLTLWQDSVSKLPDRAKPWIFLAQAFERVDGGNIPEAIQAFKHALENDPTDLYALYGLGNLYGMSGDYNSAERYVNALLLQSPEHVMGNFLLGNIYTGQGRYDQAEQAYLLAASLQPETLEIEMELANIAVLKGDMVKAQGRFQQIEARGTNSPIVAYMLSWLELRLGNEKLALSWLEKALQRGYADERPISDLAELKALRGNPRFEELLRRYGGGS